ncbi:MAG TPA: hypothetical protein VN039_12405 [Nitrospira sp.]|nr:hypothetical protein [Nitrospira sp.]
MAIKSKEDLTEVERLEKALRAFRSKTPKIGLMQRGDTYPVFDITNPAKTRVTDENGRKLERRHLWQYPISPLGQLWQVIVCRGEHESFSVARYAILDHHGNHQDMTSDQLARFVKDPPKKLEINLEVLVDVAEKAAVNVRLGRNPDHI